MLHHPADLPNFLKRWRELDKRRATEPAVVESIVHLLGQKEAIVRDALTQAGSDWIQISYMPTPVVSDQKQLFHGKVMLIPNFPECRPKFIIETREGRREELFFTHVEWMDWIKPSQSILSQSETQELRRKGMEGKIPALVNGCISMNQLRAGELVRVGWLEEDEDGGERPVSNTLTYLRCLPDTTGRWEGRVWEGCLEFTDGDRRPTYSVPLQNVEWIRRAHAR